MNQFLKIENCCNIFVDKWRNCFCIQKLVLLACHFFITNASLVAIYTQWAQKSHYFFGPTVLKCFWSYDFNFECTIDSFNFDNKLKKLSFSHINEWWVLHKWKFYTEIEKNTSGLYKNCSSYLSYWRQKHSLVSAKRTATFQRWQVHTLEISFPVMSHPFLRRETNILFLIKKIKPFFLHPRMSFLWLNI